MTKSATLVFALRRNIISVAAAFVACAASLGSQPAMAASCRADAAASIDWSECNKRLLMLGGSILDGADLHGTDFTYTDLRGSSFKKANLEKAKLIRSSLASSELEGANLVKVEAYRSDSAT